MRLQTALTLKLLFAVSVAPVFSGIDARMLQQPDVSKDMITFVYAGDIWTVSKQGGLAQHLSSPTGEESFPRFSPDGTLIAFSANYAGNTDVYVVPVSGGIPSRVTHHPDTDRILDWYPDGRGLLYVSRMESGRDRFNQLYRTSPDGGLPQKLPVPYGEFGAISPDGKWLAYQTKARDFRTWKRYRGGWAPDIWLFDLSQMTASNVTQDPANDSHPMWHQQTLYFLSDRGPEQRHNIWAYETNRKRFRQVTTFSDFDIHFPAIGPEDIVFEAGGKLYLLDLGSEKFKEVPIQVVTDQKTLLPRIENVGKQIRGATFSPTGKRAVFEARGELFSVPSEHGPVYNLTKSSGVAERSPSLSPDGKALAYWSDRSGEYELTVRNTDGTNEETLSSLGPGFRYDLYWSPDSKKLVFIDEKQTIRLFDRDTRMTSTVDKDIWMMHGALDNFSVSWSSDSRWITYSKGGDSRIQSIYLYDTENASSHQVTAGFYNDANPVFDPGGQYLYFLSNRTLQPSYSDADNSWIYANTTNVVAVALRKDVASPLQPRNDVEEVKKEDKEKGEEPAKKEGEEQKESPEGAAEKKAEPVNIDIDGFEQRLVVLPPAAGNFGRLAAVSGKIIYVRRPRTGEPRDAESSLMYYDLKERKEETILKGVNGFAVSADGKKLLVSQKGAFAIIEPKPNQKFEKPLRTAEMEMTVDPRAEWNQIFNDAWRFERDFFYDPNLHGVDWNQLKERYGRLMQDAVTRWDVNYVIGELIAELNASHAYRGGGDAESAAEKNVGLLGVDWSLENGAYRIRRIVSGAPWDSEARSPLSLPGIKVKEGDYVLAVNGVAIDTSRDPWAAFQGLAGKTVSLTVNDKPDMEGAWEILVETLEGEQRLRYLDWIERSRKRVEEASGGRVGYIYVPNTGIDGQTELVRQFIPQFTKDALIIDERFNSGGQIPDRFIELLNRPVLSYWATRDGKDWQWPPVGHFGPKVMLINGWSGSGGDAFPYYFREAGLGPLIGEKTWGGLIGISGSPSLVDGGMVTVPTFRMYSKDGKWFPEGLGVEPDIEVVDDPGEMARGRDPQLERAIQEALRLLESKPFKAPGRPAYENRTKAPRD